MAIPARPGGLEFSYAQPQCGPGLCATGNAARIFTEKTRPGSTYARLFADSDWKFVAETEGSVSNYWLCTVLARYRAERDAFLEASNAAGVITRPVREPLHTLPIYGGCMQDALTVTTEISDRLVNLPSGVS